MPPLRATAPPGVGAGTTGGGGVRKGRRPDIRAVKRPAPSGVGGGPLADSIRATRQHPRCCPGRARLSSLDAGPISNGLGLREPHGGGGVAWSEESGRGHIEVAGDPGGGRGGQSQRTRRERGVLGFGPALVDVMGRYRTLGAAFSARRLRSSCRRCWRAAGPRRGARAAPARPDLPPSAGMKPGRLVVRHVIIFGYGHGLQRAIIDESQHRTPERLVMAQH